MAVAHDESAGAETPAREFAEWRKLLAEAIGTEPARQQADTREDGPKPAQGLKRHSAHGQDLVHGSIEPE